MVAIDDFNGGDGIVAKKDIKSIADLKGKNVAFSEGSVSEFYLNVLLAKAGIKESDLKTVNMAAPEAGAAFVAEQGRRRGDLGALALARQEDRFRPSPGRFTRRRRA